MPSISPNYRLTLGGEKSPNFPRILHDSFEIRLFYVRIGPCAAEDSPEFLTLRHLSPEVTSEVTSTLRRDRVDKESSEVTYVGTDSLKISGNLGFEVYEDEDLLLCGAIEKVKDDDWGIECYIATKKKKKAGVLGPKIGVSKQMIEVYVAGRCGDVPVILTKVINVGMRRKNRRGCGLDVIPEESEKEEKVGNGLVWEQKLQLTESDEEYEGENKIAHGWYPEDMYEGEDGQLTWFNAGVRVGVGIGLGMCLGVGIGVGLLMRSYQTTTRTFRRRFL